MLNLTENEGYQVIDEVIEKAFDNKSQCLVMSWMQLNYYQNKTLYTKEI